MPHNDNYLHNILRQRLRHYRPAARGLGRGLAPPQKKNITRYKLNYLHHVMTQCTIWCIYARVRPPSKISTAVKRIAPSRSFLGAVYNHGRLYSGYEVYWAPFVSISAQ